MSIDMDGPDIGSLAWVKPEIDNALTAAHQALTDWNGEDINPLRSASTYLHQVYGALHIVDFKGVTQLTSEIERLTEAMADDVAHRTQESAVVAARGIATVKDYLDSVMNGSQHLEMRLSPVYAEVVAARSGEMPPPNDLFFPDIDQRVSRKGAEPEMDDAARAQALRVLRGRYQRNLLKVLQNKDAKTALAQMEKVVREVGRLAPGNAQYTFWWATTGLMQSLQGSVATDLWVKRVCGRVDLQIRRLMEGSRQLAERLFRDVLYHVARDNRPADLARDIQEHFALKRLLPAAGADLTATQQPELVRLRGQLDQAKDHWVRYCGGRIDSLGPFQAAATALFEAAVRLPNPAMHSLARIVQAVAKRLPGDVDATSNERLQIEVASALILASNAAEHFTELDAQFNVQAEAQSMRVQAALDPNFDSSRIPQVDMLDEISRKAQERLVLAQVAHEIQSNLHQVEEVLDRFFRNAEDRSEMPRVPGLMKQILGALLILDQTRAVELVQIAIDRIGHLSSGDSLISSEDLNWVAEALSTLSLYVDDLRFGRADIAALDRILAPVEVEPEREASVESQVREEAEKVQDAVEEWVASGAHDEGRQQLQDEISQLARDADLIGNVELREQADSALRALSKAAPDEAIKAVQELSLVPMSAPEPSEQSIRLSQASDETIEREMLDVYIEEAQEVLGSIAVQIARLAVVPMDSEAMKTIRRGFHTLKGSGRMVGLSELGELAWEVEQTLNQWLRDEKAPNHELTDFMETAADAFQTWVDDLAASGPTQPDGTALVAAARRLRTSTEESSPPKSEAGGPAEAPAAVGNTVGGETSVEVQVEVGGRKLHAELFRIFINEAADHLYHLGDAMALLGREHQANAWDRFIRAAHTLAGISRTTGFESLADAAHAVELWGNRWEDKAAPLSLEVSALLDEVHGYLAEGIGQISSRQSPSGLERVDVALSNALTLNPTTALVINEPATIEEVVADDVTEVTHDARELLSADDLQEQFDVIGDQSASANDSALSNDDSIGQLLEAVEVLIDQPGAEAANDASASADAAASPEEDLPPGEERLTEALELPAEEFGTESEPEMAIEMADGLEIETETETTVESPVIALEPTEEDVVPPSSGAQSELEAELSEIELPETSASTLLDVEVEIPVEELPDEIPVVDLATTTAEVEDAELVYQIPQPEAQPAPTRSAPSHTPRDELDLQLLPVFLEEAMEIMPRIGAALRDWRGGNAGAQDAIKRALHTLKGSARMAGAMTLGEFVHSLETWVIDQGAELPGNAFLDEMEAAYDQMHERLERLKLGPEASAEHTQSAGEQAGESAQLNMQLPNVLDTPIFPQAASAALPFRQSMRLKSDILDTLLNEAGEVAIVRNRIESALNGYKQTATELASNVDRLRTQLRELEIQAETQMRTRLSQVEESQFDPLEFDRFSRLQELTRLLAESVNDVSTAQDNLLSGLDETDTALTSQARMTRTLQQELMHIRMVPLDTLADRLHRIVRQAAKETGRRAQLEIDGGATELDRSVLDKIAAPLEHLVRNAVAHGIERPEDRQAAGKDEFGEVRLAATQEGNEIVITLTDDGVGIDYDAIRAKAIEHGWLLADQEASHEILDAFLFRSGFSTALEVTELAGRGIGLDVVKNEIAGIGGRVSLTSEAGKGTRFTVRLPLTLALTQVVLCRAGGQTWALPANLIGLVREVRANQVQALHEAHQMELGGEFYPLRTLAELVGLTPQHGEGRYRTFLLLRAGDRRLSIRVDELEGNFEAVVKNIGPQLARIAGISGATVLGDGRVAMIIDPFRLAEQNPDTGQVVEEAEAELAPLVMVVDDSLTVRKISSRFLEREGFRVVTARDGMEALEKLEEELPIVVLLDIEMPRMDGFEVAHHLRSNSRTRTLPIIMITSRTAEKHRNHASELGVNAYLGKPYNEEELLGEIARLSGVESPARAHA